MKSYENFSTIGFCCQQWIILRLEIVWIWECPCSRFLPIQFHQVIQQNWIWILEKEYNIQEYNLTVLSFQRGHEITSIGFCHLKHLSCWYCSNFFSLSTLYLSHISLSKAAVVLSYINVSEDLSTLLRRWKSWRIQIYVYFIPLKKLPPQIVETFTSWIFKRRFSLIIEHC